MNRFVFLDRDGTLIEDCGYPHRPEQYRLLPGVVAALRRLQDAGYRLAIVTNQSGIGRGYFDEAAFQAFHQILLDELAAGDIVIAASYHCPHRPDTGCACRKPAPGMLERARDELGASLAESFVIGDADNDVDLAVHAGCRGSVRVGTPEHPGLSEAVESILVQEGPRSTGP